MGNPNLTGLQVPKLGEVAQRAGGVCPNSSILNSQFVKRLALDTGFDACGLAEAGPVPLDSYDDWIARGNHADMHYMERYRDLRSHPANLFPGTRTVVSLLLGYKSDDRVPFIAQYAYGEDYHARMKRMLYALAARLKENYPDMEARPCVDSAPIPEKYWAIRAGLGWRGRNTLLVNPQFGSFINLGELLVTLPADAYDSPLANGCPPDCQACVKACPNGALQHTPSPLRGTPPNLGGEPKIQLAPAKLGEHPEEPAPAHSSPMRVVSSGDYEGDEAKSPRSRQLLSSESSSCFPQRAGGGCSTLTADLCTAYHTIENRSPELPTDLDTAGYAFGCDICQLACPYNAKSPARYHLTPSRRADLESLATADEEQFRRVTRGTAMSRITYAQWLRNLGKMK